MIHPEEESVGFHGVPSQSVLHKPEGPSCLLAVQALGHPEVCEVPVVIQDLYRVFGPFQDMSPFLKALEDRQELLVVDLVFPFS